ncbi:MAG: efflux RND transporter permease subunit, partial [Chloroflexi bacterium]|nr:efflux RND transporter permease subunit [Chloroflexota bacterium]
LPLATIVNEGSGIIGAELATVVIGGLMTSTLLTLVVIPVVYRLFRRDRARVPVPVQVS